MLRENCQKLKENIQKICDQAGRKPSEITVVVASKSQSPKDIEEVYREGFTHFAESRQQEAEPKIQSLAHLPIHWHFIGNIQSNKLPKILEKFEIIQSFSQEPHLQKAQDILQASQSHKPIYLEANISQEPTKGGLTPQQALNFFQNKKHLLYPNLIFAGLMTIAPNTPDKQTIRQSFDKTHDLFTQIQKITPSLQTLSMGMSQDYEAAIQSGSNMIRVGTTLFGPRQ